MKFKLIGDEHHRIGFNIKYAGQHGEEKRKIHLSGGKWLDTKSVDVKVVRDGTTVRIPVDEEDLKNQLRKLNKQNEHLVKIKEEEPKEEEEEPEEAGDDLPKGKILDTPEPYDNEED